MVMKMTSGKMEVWEIIWKSNYDVPADLLQCTPSAMVRKMTDGKMEVWEIIWKSNYDVPTDLLQSTPSAMVRKMTSGKMEASRHKDITMRETSKEYSAQ